MFYGDSLFAEICRNLTSNSGDEICACAGSSEESLKKKERLVVVVARTNFFGYNCMLLYVFSILFLYFLVIFS
jgi:hypothetical protein